VELVKHKNHRNLKYLNWLRKQSCVVSGAKAQCAHHIRLGTNGGSSLKPSDYFCIPLLNEYHTTGPNAIHVIGEDTFFKNFKLDRNKLFIHYLKGYLIEEFNVYCQLEDYTDETLIAYMIKLIEENGPNFDRPKRKSTKVKKSSSTIPKKSITENEYYQKAKEAKKKHDKEQRSLLKESTAKSSKSTISVKDNEFYQKAKELKRQKDKELRDQLKKSKKPQKVSVTNSDFYQKAKELKRAKDKEMRDKIKAAKKEQKLKEKRAYNASV